MYIDVPYENNMYIKAVISVALAKCSIKWSIKKCHIIMNHQLFSLT